MRRSANMPMTGRIRHSAFAPAWWLSNAHLQTLWASIIRRIPKPVTRRERLELPDGDFVDLDWTPGGSGPLVIVLHGLQGSLNSPYARGIMGALQKRGMRGVFMHFRGCSGVSNRLPRFYHSGDTGDLNTLINILREREPGTPLAAIGYSLGGNVLLKWLGEQGINAPLQAAIAVSAPFDLSDSAWRLERGFSQAYQYHLLRSLRLSVEKKFRHMPAPIALDNLENLRTFTEYDDAVTAPLHGFAGVDDYYRQSSCRRYLKHIRIPTLILHAADDPFMTPAAIPQQDQLSPSVILELSARGGHVGFISGNSPWQACYWLEQRIPDFILSSLTEPIQDEKEWDDDTEWLPDQADVAPIPSETGHDHRLHPIK
ncbi:MAG TPA: hydrolase [Gammaproteobacteria bacterium]|nr:hydrolase [Gammaproteobacteria bacterium]